MSKWFMNTLQAFIHATFLQFGQIRRSDLVREFDISIQQASHDIAEFLVSDPPHVEYDVRSKAYILIEREAPPHA